MTNTTKSFTQKISPYIRISLVAILLAFVYQLFIVKNGFAPAGLNGIATMVQYNAQGHDTIYPVMINGVLGGFVYGICFRNTASTGGTDIVSKYISKKKPDLNFFWVTFALNAVVAFASFFVYAKADASGNLIYDYKPVCLCILYCFLSSFVGNTILKGFKTACKFTIITSHADEITKEVISTLRHSCTEISAVGSFGKEEKTVLICIINKHQMVDLQKILGKYDSTFSFSETVNQTYGNFKRIR